MFIVVSKVKPPHPQHWLDNPDVNSAQDYPYSYAEFQNEQEAKGFCGALKKKGEDQGVSLDEVYLVVNFKVTKTIAKKKIEKDILMAKEQMPESALEIVPLNVDCLKELDEQDALEVIQHLINEGFIKSRFAKEQYSGGWEIFIA